MEKACAIYENLRIGGRTYAHEHNSYWTINISLFHENKGIGYVQCLYFKENKRLVIEDLNAHPEFHRKGLATLQIASVLAFLKNEGLEIDTVVAEGVGCYSPEPEIKVGVEAFWSSLGFKSLGELDEWDVDSKTLETKLESKIAQKFGI